MLRRRGCASFLAVLLALLALLCPFAPPPAFSHRKQQVKYWSAHQLKSDIEKIRSDADLPSIGFALVVGNTPVVAGAVGRANIALNLSATAETPYLMASVSKTFVATALMQMIEAGDVSSLNDPVNDHLPWTLDNPRVNKIKSSKNTTVMRISHLVTHTSGIRDRWIWGGGPRTAGSLYFPGDSPISLDEILRGYFLPGGEWYNASGNFRPWKPGQKYEYANFNGDLGGYLVEAATGIQLRDYSRNNLFTPLGMKNSGWHLADFSDPSRVAMPYNGSSNNKQSTPYGQFGYPDYPSGLLRCSPADVAEYMAAMLGGGVNRKGVRILRPSSVNASFADVFPNDNTTNALPGQGVFWYSRDGYYGEPDIGHSGSDYGARTEMWLLLNSRVGVAAMINQDGGEDSEAVGVDKAIQEVLLLLVKAGRQVARETRASAFRPCCGSCPFEAKGVYRQQ